MYEREGEKEKGGSREGEELAVFTGTREVKRAIC